MSDDEKNLGTAIEELPMPERANIALFGATGVGKSTLLNAIFGAPIAKTGVGDPVTQSTELFVNAAEP
ncbi:MAG: GTPase [Galbitalea sp.]